ncbi:MAG TPA: hypothetical protein VLW50_30890 [Streptosporangiaceae bacterium]|nr:hypothetical protein [Streptosporangiaceae bacterium]
MAALKRPHGEGILLDAYSPGGPGAVLILDNAPGTVDRALA